MKQRISEWWQMTTQAKPTLAYVGLAVVITLIIMGIILGLAIPGAKADAMVYARQQAALAMNNVTASRVQLQADFDLFRAELQQQLVSNLTTMGTQVSQAQAGMTALATQLADIQSTLAGLNQTMLGSYLDGSFGNYTIHAMSGAGGNFTATVHLSYAAGPGTTVFEDAMAGINWTGEIPRYMAAFTFNGTDWVVAELWWNVGILQLQPGIQNIFPVSCPGLNETWQPTLAYVDLFRLGP